MRINHALYIKTARLTLRPLNEADAQSMFAYTSNPVSCQYLKWEPHTDINEDITYIREALLAKDELFIAIELKENQTMIGLVHVYDWHASTKSCEISYIINPNYMGMGYASEAVKSILEYLIDEAGVYRARAICIEENAGSERVMQKAGMEFEEERPNAIMIKNKKHTIRIYVKRGVPT
jgi:ribosomal-protein-alanine N-acetyltransferase